MKAPKLKGPVRSWYSAVQRPRPCASLVDWLFIDRPDALVVAHSAALKLLNFEVAATGDPVERFFQNALRNVAARSIGLTAPADRAFLDDVHKLPFALLDAGRLIREA